jgi:hypothetical protein
LTIHKSIAAISRPGLAVLLVAADGSTELAAGRL